MTKERVLDFVSDWMDILRQELERMGYNTSVIKNETEMAIKFYNVIRRIVPATPRKVLVSKEFNCPTDLTKGLELLKQKFERGQNVQAHQSRGLKDIDRNDSMLNDWGIQHFHLKTTTEPDGYTERSGPLLFARVTPNTAYFINVFPHGSWSKQEIIEILHVNWPESIKQFKSEVFSSLSYSPTDEDIKKLRKHNLNSAITLKDGSIYGSLGLGINTDGSSAEATFVALQSIKAIKNLEAHVRANEAFEKLREGQDRPLKFKLGFKNCKTYALEEESSTAYLLLDHNDTVRNFKISLDTF